ncbi:MAG: elongation factor G [Planctomycetota bacterium]|nr:MAG: elongation factor G [Planctomycetota bacterium]
MTDYRNATFLGHSDAGKTTLVEALAHHFGLTSRQGSVDDGTTLCDFTPEEQEKKHSLGAAVVHVPKAGLNLIDTPGYPDFLADALTSMGAAGCAVVCVSARNEGMPFHAQRLWQAAGEHKLARAVVVTKADHENLDLGAVLANLRQRFGPSVVPFTLPDQVGPGFSAVGEVVSDPDSEYRSQLVDAIVESDDALMERYLEEGEVGEDDLAAALPSAMAVGTLAPLFFVDPVRGIGVSELARFLAEQMPTAAQQLEVVKGAAVAGGGADERLVARVWKVLSDKHLGQISYLRVLQGTLRVDMSVPSPRGGKNLKLSGLSTLLGKELKPIDSAGPGAIVAVTRVEELAVGDTIVSEGEAEPFDFGLPEPFTSLAVRPKSRNDEQKIGAELAKIAKEDPTFVTFRNPDTRELVVSGLSDLHLSTCLHRLEARGVGVETSVPRIAYQETVTARAEGHHRHKKQTGGSGQFGECFIRLAPNERGAGFEFIDAIVGGAIPRQFIPAVEKGILEQMEQGIIAGSKVVDIVVELYDGKAHDVDSDEVSFKIAGARALRDAFLKARPILLEPVMEVAITVPSRYFGDVSGDLNTRRGQILGMDSVGDMQIIRAMVPLAEMQTYSTPLRSMTHGEGSFTMKFDHYDQVPAHLQEKIVAELAREEE